MLKKLIKYDLKEDFKYYWIGIIVVLILSILGGISISFWMSEKEPPTYIGLLSNILGLIAFLGCVAFVILSTMIIYFRFSKNFFTDEGYLTFTLPVSRLTQLNSKVISGTTVYLTSSLTLFVGLIINFIVNVLIDRDDLTNVSKDLYELFTELIFPYGLINTLLVVLGIILCMVFSILLMYFATTISSLIAKKAKAFVGFIIYLGIITVILIGLVIFAVLGIDGLSNISLIYEYSGDPILFNNIIVTCINTFIAMLCGIIYYAEYYLLKYKLNLS